MNRGILLLSCLVCAACVACSGTPQKPDHNVTSDAVKWSALPTDSGGDVAVLGDGSTLIASSLDGQTLAEAPMGADIQWCRLDPRGEVVWVLVADDTGGALEMFDLTTNTNTVLAKLPIGVEELWIRYKDNLGIAPKQIFFDVAVEVRAHPEKPYVGPLLGCEGDRSYYCFDDGMEGFDDAMGSDDPNALAPFLMDENKVLWEALADIELLDPDALAMIGQRGIDRAVFPAFKADAISLPGIDKDQCMEAPEECGAGYLVAPDRHLYQVVVGNDRGDYYHESVQFFDASKQKFVSPDGVTMDGHPLDPEDHNLSGEVIVAPTASAWLLRDRLVKQGEGTTREGVACGWVTGGYPFMVQD